MNSAGVLGDRALDVAGRRVLERQRRPRRSPPARRSRRRGGHGGTRAAGRDVRGNSSETSTISSRSGSSADAEQLLEVLPACSERLHQPSRVRRRGGRRHHPGRLLLEHRLEAAEVGGGEADVGALVAQHALDRAVEARQVVDVRVVEERGEDEQQGRPDPQLLPVVPLAERLEQRRRLAGSERHREGVLGLEQPGGLFRAHPPRHARDPTRGGSSAAGLLRRASSSSRAASAACRSRCCRRRRCTGRASPVLLQPLPHRGVAGVLVDGVDLEPVLEHVVDLAAPVAVLDQQVAAGADRAVAGRDDRPGDLGGVVEVGVLDVLAELDPLAGRRRRSPGSKVVPGGPVSNRIGRVERLVGSWA